VNPHARCAQDDGEKRATTRATAKATADSQREWKKEGKSKGSSKSDCRSLHFASQRQERDAAVEMTKLRGEEQGQVQIAGGKDRKNGKSRCSCRSLIFDLSSLISHP
jgi:hypothetical protein